MSGKPRTSTMTKALALLEYIKSYQAKNKFMPTRREMATEFETSTSVINYWLTTFLEPAGLIVLSENLARGMRIVVKKSRTIMIYTCPACDYYTTSHGMTCTHHADQDLIPNKYMQVF